MGNLICRGKSKMIYMKEIVFLQERDMGNLNLEGKCEKINMRETIFLKKNWREKSEKIKMGVSFFIFK